MTFAASALRLEDLATFLAVVRTGSLTAASRELRVTPSQISKAIVRLERYMRRPLLARKSRGVVATDDAIEAIPRFQELLESARVLPQKASRGTILTVAAPSYLTATLVPAIASATLNLRLRIVEAGEAFIRAYAGDALFQVALTLSAQSLPRSWQSTKVGSARLGFFVAPSLATKLGTTTTRDALRTIPFVTAIYQTNGQFMPGDDGCPIPRGDRVAGHEVPTVAIALELAAVTPQIAYGPEIAARAMVRSGRLTEIVVEGCERSVDVYLHVNADHVLAKARASMLVALTASLEEPARPPPLGRTTGRRKNP